LVCGNGKSFDAALSNEAADENVLATFACGITLNVTGVQGIEDKALEAVVLRHSDAFSVEAVRRSRERLASR
jgi:hypothetical protein